MKFNIDKANSKASGIYIIRNAINTKIYIGSAVMFSRRHSQHKHLLLSQKHPSKHLLNHINKYGIDTLSFDLLELCDESDIIAREQYYLDLHQPFIDNGFNTSTVAGSTVGVKHTDQAKVKMSLFRKGTKPTEETRRKMSIAQTGRKHTPETFVKMYAAQSNKKYDEVARRNMSLAHIGKTLSEATRGKMSKTRIGKPTKGLIILNTETGIFYDSIKEASKTTQYSHYGLGKRLNGKFVNNTPFIKA